MRHRAVEGGYLLRFDRGEKLPEGIAEFCLAQRIPAATAHGLGAIEDVELGYYDLAAKSYERVRLAGSWELVSLTTFVSTWDGKPFAHTHAVVSGRDFNAKGGHLFSGTVSITAEVRLHSIATEVLRTMNPVTGLHQMEP
jgi:predicted DNA-binding protein with PD1-like motif